MCYTHALRTSFFLVVILLNLGLLVGTLYVACLQHYRMELLYRLFLWLESLDPMSARWCSCTPRDSDNTAWYNFPGHYNVTHS